MKSVWLNKRGFVVLAIIAGGLCMISATRLFAQQTSGAEDAVQNRDELEVKLLDKSKELEIINSQINIINESLKSTTQQKTSLQKELTQLKSNLDSLTLTMKKDEITIQKLNLEIDSLQLDLRTLEEATAEKKTSIENIIRALQRSGQKSQLQMFLETGTLAGGMQEQQALKSLHTQLNDDMAYLKRLNENYRGTLTNRASKRLDMTQHQKNLVSKKAIVEEVRKERQDILAVTKNKESLYQQQVADLKKKQQAIADEVEKLDEALRGKVSGSGIPRARSGTLGMPIEGGTLTQDYGSTAFAQYGYRGKWHNGVDYGAPIGTPILAAEDGEVAMVANQDAFCPRGAYGKLIVIHHDNNLTTLYAHLSQTAVSPGEKVKRGSVIGYSGKTGYSTGPHLHFTVYARPTFTISQSKHCGPMPQGGDVNPMNYLP